MSYLNSLLSSIGASTSAPSRPPAVTAPRTSSAAIPSDKSRSTTPHVVPPQKRKAEAPPESGTPAKAVKTEASVVRVKAESSARIAPRTAPVVASTRPLQTASRSALPSRPLLTTTTSTSSLQPNGITTTSIITSKTITKPTSEISRTPAPRTASTTTTTPNKPPAKSSYRAILERAEAAKKATAEQLQIKNKPVAVAPKLSHKERLAKEEETRRKAKVEARSGNKAAGTSRVDRSGLSKPISKLKVEEEVVKPKKAPVDLGYKGTMRPNPTASTSRPTPKSTSSYTGTSRTAAWIDSSKQARPPDNINDDPFEKRYRYASETEEEDEEDSDGEDKPLGFWDMAEEEEASLRAAQEEDARALREEKEHQTEKMKRKKALERMVASRAEKK